MSLTVRKSDGTWESKRNGVLRTTESGPKEVGGELVLRPLSGEVPAWRCDSPPLSRYQTQTPGSHVRRFVPTSESWRTFVVRSAVREVEQAFDRKVAKVPSNAPRDFPVGAWSMVKC